MEVTEAVYFSLSVEDQPGALSGIIHTLRNERIELAGLWGFGLGDGQAQIIVVPRSHEQFREVVHHVGISALEGICLHISGSDSLSILHNVLTKVADKGINIHALDAISTEGAFGCYLWSDESNIEVLRTLVNQKT
jgi:hypothetical protein